MNPTIKAPRLALAAALALCTASAGAAAQGYGHRSYDRDGFAREEADLPARGRGVDRFERDAFERGYRLGQEDERRLGRRLRTERPDADRDSGRDGFDRRTRDEDDDEDRGRGNAGGRTGAGRADVPDAASERERQQQALRHVRQTLHDDRTALQQGDQPRRLAALAPADQTGDWAVKGGEGL